jgi:hypothetical protein
MTISSRWPTRRRRSTSTIRPLSSIQTYHTTAHQGLLREQRIPPIPVEVLGAARGCLYAQEELTRHFSQALFPQTTNRHGCVTLHSHRFAVGEGLPQAQI